MSKTAATDELVEKFQVDLEKHLWHIDADISEAAKGIAIISLQSTIDCLKIMKPENIDDKLDAYVEIMIDKKILEIESQIKELEK